MWPLDAGAVDGLHPTRSAQLVTAGGVAIGLVGEIDPGVLDAHGIGERVAWLEVDLRTAARAGPHPDRALPRA